MTSYKERLQNFYDTCNTQKEQNCDGKILINGASCRVEYVNGRRTLVMDTAGRKDVAFVCKTLKEQGLVRNREEAVVSLETNEASVAQELATTM